MYKRQGFGFLALAVMIFGNWKPLSVAGAALLFGLFKCIAASYGSLYVLNSAGEQIYFLKDLGINTNFYRCLLYTSGIMIHHLRRKVSCAPIPSPAD